MGLMFIVERLLKEELKYELLVRGLPAEGLVKELRAEVRNALRNEAEGEVYERLEYPFTVEEDLEALGNGKKAIEKLLTAFEISPARETRASIETKLVHYNNRINYGSTASDEETAAKQPLKIDFALLMSRYQYIANKSFTADTKHDSVDYADERYSVKNLPYPPEIKEVSAKSTPVVKWNLKFSGESRSMPLSAFLERVTELMVARNVTKVQLFKEAVDLFDGKALVWFRANRSKVDNWDELSALLRREFLPIDYDERLLEEIKRRTQGADENMSIYVSVMENMFSRLSEQLDEHAKLKIVLRNLVPFYQTQLGMIVVNSFEELTSYGRKIEEQKYAIETYAPPSRRKTDLETDLAYLKLTPVVEHEVAPVETNVTQPVYGQYRGYTEDLRCWNCDKQGHRAGSCPNPREKIYCYRCGRPDFTTRNCPKCSRAPMVPENFRGGY